MKTDDPLVSLMKRFNIPITRENYLNLAYMGEVPEELGAEQEADLPPEIQRPTHLPMSKARA